MTDHFIELYREFLKQEAIRYGLDRESLLAIDAMHFPDDFDGFVQFLIDAYHARREEISWHAWYEPGLYLADDEAYDEWEL